MRVRLAVSIAISCVATSALLIAQQAQSLQQTPVFRSRINLVLVDLVVRDRSGALVKGLTLDDFDVFEDGVRQQVLTFAFEDVKDVTSPTSQTRDISPSHPLTSEEVAGHRLLTLLFDTSSMQPDDVQKAIDGAVKWVDERMTPADLVAVATINSSLQMLTDFTGSKEQVRSVLSRLAAADGTAFAAVDSSTAATDDTALAATDDPTSVDASAQELDTFNNDVRLRAVKTLADALQPIPQKKAIVYFSAGMQRSGTDNQVELRAAVNAAVRANVAIYPVDARGLQAVVPGGSARAGSRGGLAAFSGSAVAGQFTELAAQQETLTSLASDTGGTAFTDTNDFGEAFSRVERDISSYYILGFASTNTNRDGRFRRLNVRVRSRSNLRVEAKAGYYADRDFAHTGKSDREALLQEQLAAPIPATDVPLFVTAGWFRLAAADQYYVPISLAVPGAALPAVPSSANGATLDVAGFIRDERGFPMGRIRDTLTVPPAEAGSLAAKQVFYETGATLPPGHFSIKIVVRENANGRMGSFETRLVVPDVARTRDPELKVSPVILSTQLRNVTGRKSANPLVRDGVELVPNLTHIAGHDQTMYLYYEVYDPTADHGAAQLRTNLTFYRRRVKVFETPVVERTHVDASDRHAAVFQFAIPAGSLEPGLYTCQVGIVDAVASRFAFPRLQLYIR